MSFVNPETIHDNGYQEWWSQLAGHLGGIYPYYDLDDPDFYSLDIAEIIKRRRDRGAPVELDYVALASKCIKSYIPGDRSLLKNIRRAPWMAHLQNDHSWKLAQLPPHGKMRPSPDEFTENLKNALQIEASEYIRGKKKIGILLSGGMDSRVVAGVIRSLQLGSAKGIEVTGITWGSAESRDVVYAQQIASRFEWNCIHLPITPETLLDNVRISALSGAEVSPLHYHAIPQVAAIDGIEAVIAGSYGDSVGRAEFSGKHVKDLRPILPKWLDRFGLLKSSFLKDVQGSLRQDAIVPASFVSGNESLRRMEIEQEMHYMRRMLQSCMHLIARRMHVYQLFSAPQVFGLMWSLDPDIRNNSWYVNLLKSLPGELLDFPWARNGKFYHVESEVQDAYSSNYHQYGTWLRKDLQDYFYSSLHSDAIKSLGIFNSYSFKSATDIWLKSSTISTSYLDELMTWLVSLKVFIEHYDIDVNGRYEDLFSDRVRSRIGNLYMHTFVHARNVFRQ